MVKVRNRINVLRHLLVTAILLAAATSDSPEDSDSASNQNNDGFQLQKTAYFTDRVLLGINKWLTFNEWQCSAPPMTAIAKTSPPLAALYTSKIETRSNGSDVGVFEVSKMLTLVEPVQLSNGQKDEFWSYSFGSNTWRRLLRSRPTVKFDGNGRLITMCRNTIVWINDHVKDEVWVFDGIRELWSKIDIAQRNSSVAPILVSTSAVLSVSTLMLSKNRTCDCNESIIALNLTGRVDMARAMWRQSCFNAQGSYFERMDFDILPDPNNDVGYPVDIAGNTAVSGKSEALILVIAPSTGLWQYDGKRNRWRFLGNNSNIVGDVEVYSAAYFRQIRAYVLFVDMTDMVTVFSFQSGEWFTPTIFADKYQYTVVIGWEAVLVDETSDRLYWYNGITARCSQNIAVFRLTGNRWKWTETGKPRTSLYPEALGVALMTRDSLYHLSSYAAFDITGFTAESRFLLDLWRLDLTTMEWIHLFGLEWELGDDKGAVLHGGVLLFTHFTKFSHLLFVIGYIISENKLVHYENDAVSDSVPPWREEYSLVALNSTSLFLCGGVGDDLEIMSDSWILNLPSPESETAEWKNVTLTLSLSPDISRYPLPRYRHSTAVVDDTVILFGGSSHWNGTCDHDVWHLSLNSRIWTLGRSHPSSPTDCILDVLALGQQVVVITREIGHGSVFSISIYVPVTGLWLFVSKLTASSLNNIDVAPFFWRGRLLLLDARTPKILYSYIDCPPGFASRNVTDSFCQPCEVGRYSTGTGETHCLPCPDGLTTLSISATHVINCSRCADNYCKFGKCLVLQGQETPLPVCQCTAGFTGTRCKYPTYYLVALGLVVFAIVSTSGVFIILRIRKNKRRREMYLRNHVDQLNSVWQVKENEVQLLDRIGRGGYGEVHRAEYRDITVAVKIMHLPTDESLVREFEREIVYMQTIRHPNIVMFVGAGKMTEDDRPFIVLEFLHRGSVRSVLDDQELTHVRRMEFARDIANGMKFLHSLNPPRIHCDLKSDNLLVSRSWTVKIGDFGMGKLLGVDEQATIRGHKNSTKRHRYARRSSDPPTLSLLEPENELPAHAVGAARWRAPEVSARHATLGDVTVDVYR